MELYSLLTVSITDVFDSEKENGKSPELV